jgi:uncharacterized protein YgiM (DUF1202 family)
MSLHKEAIMKKLSLKIIPAILILILCISLLPTGAFAASAVSKAGQITVYGSLNIRGSASTSSPVLTSLSNGSYITLISKVGDWWEVEYGKDKYGYCYDRYIKEVSGSYAAYTTANLNIRSGPSVSYAVQSWLSKGEYVTVLFSSDGWSRILYNGSQIGYVTTSYLSAGETNGTSYASGETYTAVSVYVPSYKQFDARWAYVEVGTSGYTIKSIGCATTCIAMAESYRTGMTIYPDDAEAKLRYTAGGSIYWPSNYSSYTNSDYLSVVYNLLKSGKPVLIGLKTLYGSQHWVLITGFTGGNTLSMASVTVSDPASSYRTTLEQVVSAYPYFYKIMYY